MNDGDVVVLTAGATYQLTICEEPIDLPAALDGTPGWGDVEISGAVTIVGNGATIEQTCDDRVLYTQDEITLQSVTVTGGIIDGPGGGLFQDSDSPITLGDVTFTGNTSADGGGVATFGDVAMTGSTFTDNQVLGGGDGGGLKVFSDVAVVTIDGSTFSGNSAGGWGGAFEQEGGEIDGGASRGLRAHRHQLVDRRQHRELRRCRRSRHRGRRDHHHRPLHRLRELGRPGRRGRFLHREHDLLGERQHLLGQHLGKRRQCGARIGHLRVRELHRHGEHRRLVRRRDRRRRLSLVHVTMTNNTSLGAIEPDALSSRGLGALAVEGDAANIVTDSLTSADSVVAQPLGAVNCAGGEPQMAAAAISSTDGGYNFSDDTSCGFVAATSSQKTPNDPMLGALANNGGPTQTLLPLAGSPLLDAIPPAACGANVDQRGVTRPQGTGCDIGAVEVEALTPAPAALVTPRFTG